MCLTACLWHADWVKAMRSAVCGHVHSATKQRVMYQVVVQVRLDEAAAEAVCECATCAQLTIMQDAKSTIGPELA